jgi:hypothetical protein
MVTWTKCNADGSLAREFKERERERESEPKWSEVRDRGWEMEFEICFSSLEWDITPGKLRTRQHAEVGTKSWNWTKRKWVGKEIETTQKFAWWTQKLTCSISIVYKTCPPPFFFLLLSWQTWQNFLSRKWKWDKLVFSLNQLHNIITSETGLRGGARGAVRTLAGLISFKTPRHDNKTSSLPFGNDTVQLSSWGFR